MPARSPLWRTIRRQADKNGWTGINTAAGSAGLVLVFERGDERLEVHFGAVVQARGIPFLAARYRSSRDATLIVMSEAGAVLKILEAPRS
jgi:hypothetical protein